MTAIDSLVIKMLNHLIKDEPWATSRLRSHVGARFTIEFGQQHLSSIIDEHGLFGAILDEPSPDVSISIPQDAIAHFLIDRDRFFSSIRVSGSADIAESLAFVFRHLNWDFESDLAKAIGDIPAHRLAITGRQCAAVIQQAAMSFTDNCREYLTLESNLLPVPGDLNRFAQEVNELRDAVARLEKRLLGLS